MKKLKSIYDFIKDKLQNRRTRAITILCLYAIFFVFVFIVINTAPPSSTNLKNKEEKKNNYENVQKEYEYSYDIDIKRNTTNLKFLFTGIKTKDEKTEKIELFNDKTNTYEEIYDYEIINPLLLELKNIISYVNNIDSEFETNYKDGTIQKNYLVPLNIIDNNLSDNENIEFNIYEKDNYITKIVIDATNIDKIEDNTIINSKYTLEYSEIEQNSNEIIDKDN